jgi:hypothetical protein
MKAKAITEQDHDNPFSDPFFWIHLAGMDFSIDFAKDRNGDGPDEKNGSEAWEKIDNTV